MMVNTLERRRRERRMKSRWCNQPEKWKHGRVLTKELVHRAWIGTPTGNERKGGVEIYVISSSLLIKGSSWRLLTNKISFLGRDADVHLWNSRIVNNSLNGVRVVNVRSLVEINQTIINHNQRHGLDIDSGAGALIVFFWFDHVTVVCRYFVDLSFEIQFERRRWDPSDLRWRWTSSLLFGRLIQSSTRCLCSSRLCTDRLPSRFVHLSNVRLPSNNLHQWFIDTIEWLLRPLASSNMPSIVVLHQWFSVRTFILRCYPLRFLPTWVASAESDRLSIPFTNDAIQ